MADEPTDPTPDPDEPTPEPNPDPELGDAGKRAIAAERKTARDEKKRADAAEARVKELEDKDKTDLDKARETATEQQKRADAAEARALRLEVATAKGLTPGQAKRLVGTTQEELEADADEILADLPSSGSNGATRPKEKLRSGATPDTEGDPDLDDAVRRTRRF